MRCSEAFEHFVENMPFYGFAVLCIDHPDVQALIAARHRPPHRDLRLQPAGRRPRLPPIGRGRRRAASTSCIRDRTGERRARGMDRSAPADARRAQRRRTRWPRSRSPTSSASPTRRCARRLRRLRRRQAPLHHDRRGRRRHASSTITAIIRSRSRPCCRRRARRPRGRVIAVVQPHRYTRLAICSRSSAPASTTPTR